jgi:hypothetical protein
LHDGAKRSEPPPQGAAAYPYDQDLLEQIRRFGFHPFILVRIGETASPARQFVTCRTQNGAGEFVNELTKTSQFAQSKLIHAIERALQLETYEAADLLFGWTQEANASVAESAYVGIVDRAACPLFYDYPAFQITKGAARCARAVARNRAPRPACAAPQPIAGRHCLDIADARPGKADILRQTTLKSFRNSRECRSYPQINPHTAGEGGPRREGAPRRRRHQALGRET